MVECADRQQCPSRNGDMPTSITLPGGLAAAWPLAAVLTVAPFLLPAAFRWQPCNVLLVCVIRCTIQVGALPLTLLPSVWAFVMSLVSLTIRYLWGLKPSGLSSAPGRLCSILVIAALLGCIETASASKITKSLDRHSDLELVTGLQGTSAGMPTLAQNAPPKPGDSPAAEAVSLEDSTFTPQGSLLLPSMPRRHLQTVVQAQPRGLSELLPVSSPSGKVFVVSGPCSATMSCVRSPNYPSKYGNSQSCSIEMPTPMPLIAKSFRTEKGYDKLTINGVEYSGSSGPDEGVTPVGPMEWRSDGSIERSGWELCALLPPSSPSPPWPPPLPPSSPLPLLLPPLPPLPPPPLPPLPPLLPGTRTTTKGCACEKEWTCQTLV